MHFRTSRRSFHALRLATLLVAGSAGVCAAQGPGKPKLPPKLPAIERPADPVPTKAPPSELSKPDPRRKVAEADLARLRATLGAAGWRAEQEPDPGVRFLELEPEALLADPARARRILDSTAVPEASLESLVRIAKETKDAALRESVVRALGERSDGAGQSALVDLYSALPDEAQKVAILGALRPRRDDDPAARLLYQEAANPKLSGARRDAVVQRLSAYTARSQGSRSKSVPKSIVAKVPDSLRAELESSFQKFRGGAAPDPAAALRRIPPTPTLLDGKRLEQLTAALRRLRGDAPSTSLWSVDENGAVVTVPGSRLADGNVRQILIVPAGYTAADRDRYLGDVGEMITKMGNLPPDVYTRKYRDRIVYVVRWLPGETLASGRANFGAKLFPHPVRRQADGSPANGITMRNGAVVQAVNDLRRELPALSPIGVAVLFDTEEDVTANAVPPTFLGQGYGIARLTREDVYDTQIPADFDGHTWSEYVSMHELAHASLNFLDEYVEAALASADVRDFDVLTSAILPDDTWQGWRDAWESLIGNYDIRLSEILADNGSDNLSTRSAPARVHSDPPAYPLFQYERAGGMFFGAGTFHDDGNNVMNDSRRADGTLKTNGDRLGFAHSPSQRAVLEQVFGNHQIPRPNDRIRNAGPMIDWLPQLGSSVRLLLFDADKNHRWHPTTRYQVRVGWYEWHQNGVLPWDGEWVWTTMTRDVTPSRRTVDLSRTIAAGGLGALRDVLVFLGVTEIDTGEQSGFNLAALSVDQLLNQALPAIRWPTPYQDVSIALPYPNRYYWKFRTYNDGQWSSFTEYTPFTKL